MFQRQVEENLGSLIWQLLDTIFPGLPPVELKDPSFEIPRDRLHGHLATPLALRLASLLKKNPFEIGTLFVKKLSPKIKDTKILANNIDKIELAPPGFINFFFSQSYFHRVLSDIIKTKHKFGRLNIGKGKKVMIEFVSANPTGPLSVAHGRQAAVGDVLSNILGFCGYKVAREYYINDEGNQINMLGESIKARYRQLQGEPAELPENGYQGDYIYDIARQILQSKKIPDANSCDYFSAYGLKQILKTIKKDLADFGVEFDNWFAQSSLKKGDKISRTIFDLRKSGLVYDKEGAVWFKSSQFRDDKDRVIIKSDGSFTYLAPDIAYHRDKYARGFEWLINIWGPDHHGYISRLKAAVEALGRPQDSLSVIIVQLATLFQEGKPIQMSTRRAQYISLREVIDEVGRDAARLFFLTRKTPSHLDFDLELAKKQTPQNPVYYIQYAYARISGILRKARLNRGKIDFSCLDKPEELGLSQSLSQFPKVLELCLKQLDPYSLAEYAIALAADFHKFYDRYRVLGEDKKISQARLGLVLVVKIVLDNALGILGVSRPEKM